MYWSKFFFMELASALSKPQALANVGLTKPMPQLKKKSGVRVTSNWQDYYIKKSFPATARSSHCSLWFIAGAFPCYPRFHL